MKNITVKFGGSSLADAGQIRKVAEILKADPERRYLVVSAPGKRFKEDEKVTDLLYAAYRRALSSEDISAAFEKIAVRYQEIIDDLEISFDLEAELSVILDALLNGPSEDYIASRGEYLNGKIIAAYLGWEFKDPADMILFKDSGLLDEETTNGRLFSALKDVPYAVIPGFYGAFSDGRIRTFSRGGSDVTGALVARAVSASVYENWTDVSGMLFTDPRIVKNPRTIDCITYKELRELSYMGASVLHEDAVFPVRKARIPINIRNTNRPEDKGTMILSRYPEGYDPGPITGIAGRKGFVNIYVEKAMMNQEVGFGARLLSIFAEAGVPFEHCPTGIDTIAVVVSGEAFLEKEEEILGRIEKELQPDDLKVETGIAVIAVVGEGIIGHRGIAMRVFRGVANKGVNVRMIDSGAGEMNIILSVADSDFEATIRGIYEEFC